MKNKTLIMAILLCIFSLNAFAKADCSDPKNRPRNIAGILVGGHKDCYRKNNVDDTKADFDATIGRNPVTGKVTSKAKLLGGDKATNNLEKAQMDYGKKKVDLEEAEKIYAEDASVKNSRRVDKARKAFEKAQNDLKAAEEIKEKADRRKGE